jgi:hypothetical protein
VREWIEALIFLKTRIHYCTFKELHDLRETTHPTFKDLYVVGFNLNTQLAHTFSYESTPDGIISDAIRVSMSIPFLFQPHCPYYKRLGSRVRDGSEHRWVDGGVAENYPLSLFDWGRYAPEGANLAANVPYPNPETLGFYLTHGAQHAFLLNQQTGGDVNPIPARTIHGLQDYTQSVLSALMGNEYNHHIRAQESQRTVYIDHGEVDTLDFDLTEQQIRFLLQAGWKSVCAAYNREDLVFPETLKRIDTPAPVPSPAISSMGVHRKDGGTQVAQTTMRALISDAYLINDAKWVLALVRAKESEHSFLLIEGVCNGVQTIFRSDLFLDASNRPSVVKALSSIDFTHAVDTVWGWSASTGHGAAFIRLAALEARAYDRLMDPALNV